jgi:sugar lactone lactonase YvrE
MSRIWVVVALIAGVSLNESVASAAEGCSIPWRWRSEKTKKFRTPLNAVRCLAIDADGKLLAGDSSTREIYRFDDAGKPQPLTKGNVGIPMTLAVTADGSILSSDIEIQRIVKIPAAGGEPQIMTELAAVRGMAVDRDGRVWAVCHGKDAVIRFSPDFKEREVVVSGRPFQFSHHLAFDGAGTPFVIDGYAKTLWKIEGSEAKKVAAGEPWKNPVGLAWSESTGLIVADPHQKAVYSVNAEGKVTQIIPAP